MRKSQLILVLGFLLTLGAGIVVGMILRGPLAESSARADRGGGRPTTAPGAHGHSWLTDQLNLSESQRQQMHAIWEESLQAGQKSGERRKALQKERDDALQALLSADQRQQYDRLVQDYGAKVAELNKDRERAFKEAQERTKAILSDAQRAKFEQLMNERSSGGGHGRGMGPSRRGMGPRPATTTTMPATAPTTMAPSNADR